ncbi:hypothetical protein F7725_025908 [Dissostichus mawsoni]|uniref:WxxW domain-containing protein n=1 Tax=Dissostichus mawsoni TaxID=36200 RepID=A0A7J5X5Y9_DISMA|nr:hypothetical protein F7725_025908 [Dissostichus mawsoni]
MICGWSEWINLGNPTSGPNGGDDESIHNIISAGYHICSAPEEVQCRSVLYPGLPMSEMGQTVTCNKDVGFICNNKQQGPTQQCFDYEIRLKCCDCQTPSTRYNYNTLNSLHHSNNYNTLNSFHHSKNYNTLYYFQHSNNCNPINSINNSYSLNTFEYKQLLHLLPQPNNNTSTNHNGTLPGGHDMTCGLVRMDQPWQAHIRPNGGDDESIHNIISAGYHICSAPEEVQCRSVLYPGLPMSEMGQTVTCNKDVGFICNNKQQGPTQHTNYTLNTFHYSNICNTLNAFHDITTTIPSLPPPHKNYNTLNYFHHSTNYNTLYYFHHSNNCNTINSINNSYSLNTFEYNNYYTFYHNRNNNTSAITTAPCPGGHDMTCGWSEWINLGKPTSGPNGGDDESIHNIISAGYHICSAPEEVQCRSVFPCQMGQTVTCNKDVGFICNNKQQGPTQQCFDYEIRLKCCGCQTPSTTGLTTPSTPSTTVTTITTSTPSTTVTTTTPQLLPLHNNNKTIYSFHHSNNYNTLNAFHHSNNNKPSTPSTTVTTTTPSTPSTTVKTTTPSTPSTTVTTTTPLNSFHYSNNYNTLNSFHHSNNYNTLNAFHHSNNYNTLNAFHHSNNYNTLNYFHYGNNYNTLNAFHHSNNYNTLNSFHYSNNYNTLNAFHHSNNYNTLNSFHYSNNYNTLNAFHHSKNYNTLNAFHHSKNYNTLNYFNHSTNYDTLYYFHHSNNCNTINSFNNSYSLNTFEYNNYYTFYHNRNNNTSANHNWTLPWWT